MTAFLSARSTGTIFNPWYELEPHVVVSGPGTPPEDYRPRITPSIRVLLPQQQAEVFFRSDELILSAPSASSNIGALLNPIRYFIAFRTFVDYNIIGFPSFPVIETEFAVEDYIPFSLDRIIPVIDEIDSPDGPVKTLHHETERSIISVPADSIGDFLRILNSSLYYSLAFYLIGCSYERYFLVEFYKSFEAIRNSFGSEREFLNAMRPHGISRTALRKFRHTCNDMRQAPLDIGRHAPAPGATLYSIDLRNILVEPRSREVFVSATEFVRQVIDGYIAFLQHHAA